VLIKEAGVESRAGPTFGHRRNVGFNCFRLVMLRRTIRKVRLSSRNFVDLHVVAELGRFERVSIREIWECLRYETAFLLDPSQQQALAGGIFLQAKPPP